MSPAVLTEALLEGQVTCPEEQTQLGFGASQTLSLQSRSGRPPIPTPRLTTNVAAGKRKLNQKSSISRLLGEWQYS